MLHTLLLINFGWRTQKELSLPTFWRQKYENVWGQSKFLSEFCLKNPKCRPDFLLQWWFKVVSWSFVRIGFLKRQFWWLISKFPLQYSFIEIPISDFHFRFSSSIMISITSANFLSSIPTFFIFFHWLCDVRWFSSYFGQNAHKLRKLRPQKTKSPVGNVQKKSKIRGWRTEVFDGERRKLWQNERHHWIEQEIVNKMHIFTFVQRFNLTEKNTSQKRGIAKDFFKFFHTGILRHVIGLVLLSNNFNFCWLAIVSKPEKDLRY